VQRRGSLDHVLGRLASRDVGSIDPSVLAALRLGLFELLFSHDPDEHAAVHQAVELAKAGARRDGLGAGRSQAAASFANALLRRAARERERLLSMLADPGGDPATALSYPGWIVELWRDELGEGDALRLMEAMNEPAETAFRVNTLRAEPEAIAANLREAGTEVLTVHDGLLAPGDAIVVGGADAAVQARVKTGELVPQSRGSQAVVELLDPRPAERVLDVCAGPGIKTTAIAARMRDRGELVSVEIDERRASEISALCERTGVSCARVVVGDAAEADLGAGYDRVLVDPPCSDLGTLASRPDARWRKTAELVERLAGLQRRILVRAARALAPGGTLVYSTCTISRRENSDVAGGLERYVPGVVADDLGREHPRLVARADRRFLQLRPDRDGTTGFFIARFRGRGA
jgi:16S rRNA (cytosine967-C5)-methyltransferase